MKKTKITIVALVIMIAIGIYAWGIVAIVQSEQKSSKLVNLCYETCLEKNYPDYIYRRRSKKCFCKNDSKVERVEIYKGLSR